MLPSDREAGQGVVHEQHPGLLAEALEANGRVLRVDVRERLLDPPRGCLPVASDARERDQRRQLAADPARDTGEVSLGLADEVTRAHQTQNMPGFDRTRQMDPVAFEV